MKALKNIFFVLLGLIILLGIIGLFLPKSSHTERSIIIKSKAEIPFNLVNNLKEWSKWSPWHALDTATIWTFSDNPVGKDAFYTWSSENSNVGKGKLTITESKPNEFIATSMIFEGMDEAKANFIFETKGDEVTVKWTLDSELGFNPFFRYFGLVMDNMVGPDYEKGLAKLKEESEKAAQGPKIAGFDAEIRDFEGMEFFGIREKMKGEEIGAKLGEYYGKIMDEQKIQNLSSKGAPFTINYSASGNVYDIEAAIGFEGQGKDNGIIKKGKLESGKALVVKYYGDYMNTGKVYLPAFEYLSSQGMKATGAPLEFYITDPMTEKDTTKWLTEIVFRAQ
ncbi:MAG: SRPBCC family protein [Bacteroidia bacterium]